MRVRAVRSRVSRCVAAPLSLLLALVGCTTTEPPGPPATGPVVSTNCGTPVEVTAPPARAVTLNQPATEIMLALGLAGRMSGTAYLDDEILPEYATEYATVPVLAERYPSAETLLAAEPDFVYASFASAFGDEGVGDRAELSRLGIPTYTSPAGCAKEHRRGALSMEDVFTEVREIAAIFGVSPRAEALIAEQRRRIDTAVSSAATGPGDTVLWWDGGADAPSVGACCGAPGMIMKAVGASNGFADLAGGWAATSWETVAERDPALIVLVDASWDPAADKVAFLRSHPTLRNLRAVAGQRIVTIPFSATSAGVRNVLAIEALAAGIAATRTGTNR